jgi:hypothetical protein
LPAAIAIATLGRHRKGAIYLVAANVQSGQQRFTVVKLPVVQIVLETLALPFRHLQELIKYGWIPFAGSLGLRLIDWLLRQYFPSGTWSGVLMTIGHFALFVPFSVTWTRVTIYGSEAKLPSGPFVYGRTEWQYTAAIAVLIVTLTILVGMPLLVYQFGHQQFSAGTEYLGAILLAVGSVLVGAGYVRFAFVFPAIAISRYRGIGPAWRQTTGNLERLALLIVLSIAPYETIGQIVRFAEGDLSPGLAAMTGAFVQMLMIAMAATAGCSAPALAYKWIVLGQGRSQLAGSVGAGR